jgi:hypothetical protein
MKHILLIALLLACTGAYSQKRYYADEEKKQVEAIPDFHFFGFAKDTLFMENHDSVFFFAGSPVEHFTGYGSLIYKDYLVLPQPGNIGYSLSWILKDNRLYIEGINVLPAPMGVCMQYDADGRELGESAFLPQEEANRKLEKFLGRNFNSEKLLEADWVTGTFFLVTVRPEYLTWRATAQEKDKHREHVAYFQASQKVYTARFEKGLLVELKHREDLDQKARNNSPGTLEAW